MTDEYGYMLVKAVVTLGFLLALIGASFWALRVWMRRGKGQVAARRGPMVKVVATTFLGNKKNVSIVEVAGEMLVLGMTPTTISLLTRIKDPAMVEELKSLKKSGAGSILGFLTNG